MSVIDEIAQAGFQFFVELLEDEGIPSCKEDDIITKASDILNGSSFSNQAVVSKASISGIVKKSEKCFDRFERRIDSFEKKTPSFFSETFKNEDCSTVTFNGSTITLHTASQRLMLQIFIGVLLNSDIESSKKKAARVYVKLLSIQGAVSYRIFHQSLFRSVLSVLETFIKNSSATKTRGSRKRQNKPTQRRNNKRNKNLAENYNEDSDDDQSDDGHYDAGCDPNGSDKTVSEIICTLAEGLAFSQALRGRLEETDLSKRTLLVLINCGSLYSCDNLIDSLITLARACKPDMKNVIVQQTLPLLSMSKVKSIRKADEKARDWGVKLTLRIISSFKDENETKGKKTEDSDDESQSEHSNSYIDRQRPFSVLGLKVLEHLCVNASDRNETRRQTVVTVNAVLSGIPDELAKETDKKFDSFLDIISQSKSVSHRCLSTEIAACIFQNRIKMLSNQEPEKKEARYLNLEDLIELISGRVLDKMASVRVSGLKSLEKVIQSLFYNYDDSSVGIDLRKLIKHILPVVKTTTCDAKPVVRKAALNTLCALLCSKEYRAVRKQEKWIRDATYIFQRSRDVSLSIRSLVIEVATSIFQNEFLCEDMWKQWMKIVFASVHDTEQSVQTKAVESIRVIIFDRLSEWLKSYKEFCKSKDVQEPGPESSNINSVWLMLNELNDEYTASLRRALGILVTDKKVNLKKFVECIEKAARMVLPNDPGFDHIKSFGCYVEQQKTGAWALINMVCGGKILKTNRTEIKHLCGKSRDAFDSSLLFSAWENYTSEEENNIDDILLIRILNVVIGISSRIPAADATSLAEDFDEALRKLDFEPGVLQKCLSSLCALCFEKTPNEKDAREMISQWGGNLVGICEGILTQNLDKQTDSDVILGRAIFLIGELSLLGFDPDGNTKPYLRLKPELTTLVMGFLSEDREFDESKEKDEIKAHSMIATGKMCMADKKLAKDCVHMFIRELSKNPSEVVRSNIVVILGDICRRYTSLIDRHIPTVSASLCDPSALVRRNALVILTGLLQEDYIKWQKCMLCRFAACMVDDNEEISSLAKYALTTIFNEKNPTLLHGIFTELVFAMNGHMSHPKYKLAEEMTSLVSASRNTKDFSESENGLQKQRSLFLKDRIMSSSDAARSKRLEIYTTLLEEMSDPSRLEVNNKLCRDILGGFLDGIIPLPKRSKKSQFEVPMSVDEQLFRDCLDILCSPAINVKATRRNGNEEDGEKEVQAQVTSAAAAMAAAKKTVLSKLERKNVMENVVPLVLSLYRMLQRNRSGMIRYLVPYFAKIMKDFKEEVNEVLGAENRIVAEEIEFALRKQAQKQAEKERKENIQLAREKAKQNRMSVSTARRASAIGAGRTPIPTTCRRNRRKTFGGNSGKCHITPLTRAVVSSAKRPVLQANSMPKLRVGSSIKRSKSESASKSSRKVHLTGVTSTAKKSARVWSVEPSKIGIAKEVSSDDENKNPTNLTQQLMGL